MGQQPNIHLGIEDLPRPEPHPAAPRRWSPKRPGELGSPEDMPWGGAFATPGPDSGYAYVVLAGRPSPAREGEDPHDVERALATLMVARASRSGRAPVGEDAEVAELLLGYHTEGLPEDVVRSLSELRKEWLPGFAHAKHRDRELVAAIDGTLLVERPESIRRLLADGTPAVD